MSTRTIVRAGLVLTIIAVAGIGFGALHSQAASGGRHCPRHVKACDASQVGQPCDPNNLNVICSAQADGAYCCLASAP